MSKKARNIVYLGDQRDLFLVISNYFKKREDNFFTYSCMQVKNVEQALEHIPHTQVSLVIVDFCESERPAQEIMEPLCLLKKRITKQSLPIGGVFNNKKQIANFEGLFGLGLNYAFVKGSDHKQALNSLFYIAFEDETPCLSYAMAKGFKLPSKIYSLGFISEFDQSSLTVDKDFRGEDETVEMQSRLFEDFKATTFLQQESFERGFSFDTLYSETLQIEFASGWEEGENLIFEDTFTSWIDFNKETFISKKGSAIIYSQDPAMAKDVWEASRKFPQLDIHLRDRFVEAKKEILQLKPDLILFQIDEQSSHDELNALLVQMSYERELGGSIVSVFKHPSTTDALRKAYNRPNLLGSGAPLNQGIIFEMLKRLTEAREEKESFSFAVGDPRAVTSFPLDMHVTSLTENEITFMTEAQLPLYTVLKMSVPQEMYIAVIPSLKNLSPNIHGYHYMGFIFGIDSAESSYLRKYVNHILEKGIKEWKRIDLSAKVEVVKPEVEEPLLEREEDKKEEGKATASKEAETGFRVKSKNKLAKL